jgi:tRNA(fMet)-specific endonuclease VapC
MKRFLLDTGIASDFINRRHNVFERAREEVARGNRIGIGIPVLGELLAGIELSVTREENLQRLRRAVSVWLLWPFDEAAAEAYGRIYAILRRMGRPMQQVDMQIAAIGLSLGNTTVVSSDSDLAAVPDLSIENWAATSLE